MSELGEYLKQVRIEKDLSIDEVQSLTKIQKRYLVAIEENDLSVLPGKFYARAFIKQYAEALGLKPEEVFSNFQGEVPVVQSEDDSVPYSRVRANSAVRMGDSSRWLQFLPKIVLGMFIVGALLLIYYLFSKFDDGLGDLNPTQPKDDSVIYEQTEKDKENATKADEKSTTDSGTKITDADSEQNSDEGSDAAGGLTLLKTVGKHTTYELTGTDSLKVRLEATGSTFVKIRNRLNGAVRFERTLKADDVEEIDQTSDGEVFIYLGTMANAKVYINDEELPYPDSKEKTQYFSVKLVEESEDSDTEDADE